MRISIVHLVIILLLLSACTGPTQTAGNGQPVTLRHATLLKLQDAEGYVTADILNPWDSTRLLHRYVLVEKECELPATLPQGDLVRIPLTHAVIATSVHASLVSELGAYGSIAGVCDSEYMYLDRLRQDIRRGLVVDCGNSMSPNLEKILDLSPDAILLSLFENSGSYGKLGAIGIPLIECADYMETSPLGRAEWMRFYGLLTGHRAEADSLFAAVERAYTEMKALAETASHRPTVLTEKKTGATWYVAGGRSTVGQFLADAGADYLFSDEQASGAVPYNPEVVFDRGQEADCWLVKYNQESDMTYDQLAEEWPNYRQFAAYRQQNVYGCNLSKVPFYEETPFHPDLLLRDYITIFHPEVMPGTSLRYFRKLKE